MAKHQAGPGTAGTDVSGQDARTKLQDVSTARITTVFIDHILAIAQVEPVGVGTGPLLGPPAPELTALDLQHEPQC